MPGRTASIVAISLASVDSSGLRTADIGQSIGLSQPLNEARGSQCPIGRKADDGGSHGRVQRLKGERGEERGC